MSNTHTIPCPRCSGHGRMPLPPHYEQTLEIIADSDGITTTELSDRTGLSVPAMCQRLSKMVGWGLVWRSAHYHNAKWYASTT